MIIPFLKNNLPKPLKIRLSKYWKKIRCSIFNVIVKSFDRDASVLLFFLRKVAKIEFKPIVWIDTSNRSFLNRFNPPIMSKVYGPKDISGHQTELDVVVPGVELHKFSNVVINERSSHFISNDCVYMERLPLLNVSIARYSTGFVLEHNQESVLVKTFKNKELEIIETGIFLGGNGSWNYYHWMIEILPKMQFILKNKHLFETQKFIVPIYLKNIKSFWDSFLIFYSGSVDDLIFIDTNTPYKVITLLYLTNPSNVLFNSRQPESKLDYCYFNFDNLKFIQTNVLNLLSNSDNTTNSTLPRKFFMARKPGSARTYNQDEVSKVLADYKIYPIYLEDYSFCDQVMLFQNAELIVGASGAAWTNLIFCKEGAKAISWLPEHIASFSVFSTLAKWRGVDMRFFLTKPDNIAEFHGSYKVDTSILIKQMAA